MYSGTTLTPMSGRVLGTHQKIDRLAHGSLKKLIGSKTSFPSTKLILHFEGSNGPDAIKRKSPSKDEPWHYFTPFDETDTRLTKLLADHYDELVQALRRKDEVRAAFEAAWLAHAVVDGLTPAHHFPYEKKLGELRGESPESRSTLKEKILLPGETRRKQVSNNWKMWGPKGLFTTHFAFEWGVGFMLVPLSMKRVALKPADMIELRRHGVIALFRLKAKEIAAYDLYGAYQKHGWTPKVARAVRKKLVPVMVQMVVLAWYAAAVEAGLAEHPV